MEKQKAKVVNQQAHWDHAQRSSASPPSLMAEADPTFDIGYFSLHKIVNNSHHSGW